MQQTMLTPEPIEPTSRAYFSRETVTTATTTPLKTPAVGRIVNYVLEGGRSRGEIRPAMIVRIWGATSTTVQLQVFTDGLNDFSADYTASGGIAWRPSVQYSESHEPGTWHWANEATQFPIVDAINF